MMQTEMETVCCDAKKFEILVRVKQEGKAKKLKNIIVYDEINLEERSKALELGLKVYLF
jgi:trehalose-6-phosphate synthase